MARQHRPGMLAGRLRRRLPLARILLVPFASAAATSSGLRTSATATRVGGTCSTSTATAPTVGRPDARCTCTAAPSAAARKNREARPCSTGSRARAGCVSARTTGSARPRRSPTTWSMSRRSSPGCASTAASTGPTRRWCSWRAAPPAVTWPSLAALTPNDPAFQPGFESADTSVTAAISPLRLLRPDGSDGAQPSSPSAYVRAGCAAVLRRARRPRHPGARRATHARFVERLRPASSNPVVYAELPGAQHTFDLFHSLRFETRHRRQSKPSPRGCVRRTVDAL